MFKKIIFPTDFSKGAEKAIEKFGQDNQVKIGDFILLHVVDSGIIDDFMQAYSSLYDSEGKEIKDIEKDFIFKAEEKIKREKERIKKFIPADNYKTLVKIGTPHEQIVETAEKEGASLILLPSHGKLSFSRELFGSVAMRILRETEKPVLLIKSQ